MGYKDELGFSQMPGYQAEVTSEDRIFLANSDHVVHDSVQLHKDTVDNENTGKTTRLRPGLALKRVEGGGNDGYYVNCEHADAPTAANTKDLVILAEYKEMKDQAGVVQHVTAKVVRHGFIMDGQVLWGSGTSGADKTTLKGKNTLLAFVTQTPS
jgi:hypothetical protein